MSSSWDVIIIGGGPAGSSAATTLAQEGRRVLVLEKERFPRFHIGESLLPYNMPLFKDLGVEEKVRDAGFMLKRGAQFWVADASHHARLSFANGIYTEHPQAIHVERSVFDELLLNHARSSGAEAREGCTVLSHKVDDEGVVVRYRDAEGSEQEVRGTFLMDASGLGNFTANKADLREHYANHKKVAIFSHFHGLEMPDGEHLGDILIVRRENSWCWLIPLSPEKTSVGLVLDRAEFQSMQRKPEDLFHEVIARTPALQKWMARATQAGPTHVVADFSYRNRQFVSPRLVRVGDAAGFIDPIFSSGVFLAMQSGRQGAMAVHEAIKKSSAMTGGMRRYEKAVRQNIDYFWEFIEGFYTKPFTELFFDPQEHLNLSSAVNAVLAGRTTLPFAVRWRLRIFFLLTKLQRWIPLAPRKILS